MSTSWFRILLWVFVRLLSLNIFIEYSAAYSTSFRVFGWYSPYHCLSCRMAPTYVHPFLVRRREIAMAGAENPKVAKFRDGMESSSLKSHRLVMESWIVESRSMSKLASFHIVSTCQYMSCYFCIFCGLLQNIMLVQSHLLSRALKLFPIFDNLSCIKNTCGGETKATQIGQEFANQRQNCPPPPNPSVSRKKKNASYTPFLETLPHTPSNSHFVREVKLRLAYRLAFVIKKPSIYTALDGSGPLTPRSPRRMGRNLDEQAPEAALPSLAGEPVSQRFTRDKIGWKRWKRENIGKKNGRNTGHS